MTVVSVLCNMFMLFNDSGKPVTAIQSWHEAILWHAENF